MNFKAKWNLITLLKLENMFKFIIGIQKVKYSNGSVKHMGKIYKTYATIIGIFNSLALIYHCVSKGKYFYATASGILRTVFWLTRVLYALLYITIVFGNIYIFPKKTIDIFYSFEKIDNKFKQIINYNNNIKKRVILSHLIFIMLLLLAIMSEFIFTTSYTRLPIAINIILVYSIELLHFLLEMNEVVERVKIYNKIVMDYNMEILKNEKNIFENKFMHKMKLKIEQSNFNTCNMIYIYDKICSVINDIDFCYRFHLFMKIITMFNHCLCMSSTFNLYGSYKDILMVSSHSVI